MTEKPIRSYIYVTDFLLESDTPLPCPQTDNWPDYVEFEDPFNDFYIENGQLKSKTIEARRNNRLLRKLRQ